MEPRLNFAHYWPISKLFCRQTLRWISRNR